ncbi:AAC(3) family N-acetyltransferase [Muribaculum intestinale]|jgi:aminoglycoside 3-N-acetyltransferase|nr:AAC(3) family N-acetyltransferase [Muribaculum intestinale]
MGTAIFFRDVMPIIKKFIGIKDISLWRKRWNKRIGKLIYHTKYDADSLIEKMKELGMKEGSVVCIHASMMQFYNYIGSAEELIDKILSVLGPEGTLMMPAFPPKPKGGYDKYVFNPNTDKTAAGHLAEVFRNYPGVKRSLNVHHSVCAIGKYADYLTKDHTNGVNCWDETSPWFRICELNGLVFNLGLPRSYMGTFHHCVEGILYKEHPYWAQFFTKKQKYSYRLPDNTISVYYNIEGELIRKTRKKQIFRYFTSSHWRITRISNLEIKVFYSRVALNKMLELGRKGISAYYIPSPKNFDFNGK